MCHLVNISDVTLNGRYVKPSLIHNVVSLVWLRTTSCVPLSVEADFPFCQRRGAAADELVVKHRCVERSSHRREDIGSLQGSGRSILYSDPFRLRCGPQYPHPRSSCADCEQVPT